MEWILLPVLLGLIPAVIARKKGRSFGLWWLFGFLLFIVALPMAIIMDPDTAGIELGQMRLGMKKCLHCAEMIKEEAVVCRYCGNSVAPPRPGVVAARPATRLAHTFATCRFFLALNGTIKGPFPAAEVERFLREKFFSAETPCRMDGSSAWQKLKDFLA